MTIISNLGNSIHRLKKYPHDSLDMYARVKREIGRRTIALQQEHRSCDNWDEL
jgi:hypothetical protein